MGNFNSNEERDVVEWDVPRELGRQEAGSERETGKPADVILNETTTLGLIKTTCIKNCIFLDRHYIGDEDKKELWHPFSFRHCRR